MLGNLFPTNYAYFCYNNKENTLYALIKEKFMNELKCPHCGQVFSVDESGYANIANQVRDSEFHKELERRERELEQRQESDLKLAKAEQDKAHMDALAKKDSDLAEKDRMIAELRSQLQASEIGKQLAVNEAVQSQERESAKTTQEAIAQKDLTIIAQEREIAELKAQLQSSETSKKLAVSEAIQAKDKEISEKSSEIMALQGKLSVQETENALRIKGVEERHAEQLKAKDEQIAYYKDFKAKQSTKMIGESLEQHCLNQFNQIRMTAFPTAYFEKDNDARTGSKGDFIFRESKDGTEFLSIMFEMKNEGDETATKHKNEDFFKELDKDRREKGCEYAVLVSLLEADNEYYNTGIVDVSYRYPKMYVVRPQFFITIITLLRNAALNSLKYQQELQIVRNQQLDLTNFESNMQAFKDGFARNYRLASERFAQAIEEIDKTIDHLQKTKAALMSSENNLRLANNKAEELSIKRLTKNAPSVRAMFDAERGKQNAIEELDDV
jgi:hypothetical protein